MSNGALFGPQRHSETDVIGVIATGRHLETAQELFELFKTPWEQAVPGRTYRVILTGDVPDSRYDADFVLVYSSVVRDDDAHLVARRLDGPVDIQWCGSAFPVYGPVALFAGTSEVGATCSGHSVECESRRGGQTVRRVGYDLFDEIGRLLTVGQPVERSLSPTLEWHIALLRSILVSAGVSFVEVPPRPYGHDFICCLTHDLDFFGIRRHRFDRTMLGFLYRSTVGTLIDFVRGRRSLDEAVRNWTAVLALPFVLLGLLPDPWRPFDDYSDADGPERSTFFLVPFKERPGVGPDGVSQPRRAVAYQVADIRDEVNRALARGSEIALHGIDAWRDSASGRRERGELTSVIGQPAAGVRMHWLYFDKQSPAQLEAAGFTYDSTWGYNEAVGYRAGTSQVFRLSGTNLLELPLSIMDSALLFPNRMNLTHEQASQLCRTIVDNAVRFGGTVVVNWHDRSLAPERLWNRSYASLRSDIERRGRVWFATAGQAVEWYRWRRSIRFTRHEHSSAVSVVAPTRARSVPAAMLKTYGPSSGGAGLAPAEERFAGGVTVAAISSSPGLSRHEMQAS
jgi:hypothetical protein